MGSSLLDLGPEQLFLSLCHHLRALPDGFCGAEAHVPQILLECRCYDGGWLDVQRCFGQMFWVFFFSQLAPTLILASRFFLFQAEY